MIDMDQPPLKAKKKKKMMIIDMATGVYIGGSILKYWYARFYFLIIENFWEAVSTSISF